VHADVWEFNMKAPAAALLVVAGLSMAAQAAQPEPSLALACEGTKSWSTKRPPPPLKPLSPEEEPTKDTGKEPFSTNIIVSFKYETVEGFGKQFTLGAWDNTFIGFLYSIENPPTIFFLESFTGRINRMIGVVEAQQSKATKQGWVYQWTDYLLNCKKMERKF
jgi:hypothetical protein